MAKDFSEIVSTMTQRRSRDDRLIRDMIEVRDRYNADWTLPMPELEEEPELPAPLPYIVAEAVDGTAMRANSVAPFISVPAVEEGKQTGIRSQEYAAIRRRALYANWHDHSVVGPKTARAYRHLAGYGTCSVVVVPDFKDKRARPVIRDPMATYPEYRDPDDVREPIDVGFVYGKSAGWLVRQYPDVASRIKSQSYSHETIWDLVEWIDEDHIVIGILGQRNNYTDAAPGDWFDSGISVDGGQGIELSRYPNRAGMVPVAAPRRVTLDRVASQVNRMVPTADLLNRMMALEVVAAEKGVFPDLYIVGREGQDPEILTGTGKWEDGRTGIVNELRNVSDVGQLSHISGPMTMPTIDRLERSARKAGGADPLMGGEMPGSNLRTGRAISQFTDIAVDPRIAELHDLMGRTLQVTNKSIFAVEEGYWPAKEFQVYSGWPSDKGHTDYVPEKHFSESHSNTVDYAFPGADVTQTTVMVGQLIQAGLMSRKTARVKHPFITDADLESDMIIEERLEDAATQMFMQKAAGGEINEEDLIRVLELVRSGEPLVDAVRQANEDAQERQAQQAQRPSQEQPGMSASGPAAAARAPRGQPQTRTQKLRQLVSAFQQSQGA